MDYMQTLIRLSRNGPKRVCPGNNRNGRDRLRDASPGRAFTVKGFLPPRALTEHNPLRTTRSKEGGLGMSSLSRRQILAASAGLMGSAIAHKAFGAVHPSQANHEAAEDGHIIRTADEPVLKKILYTQFRRRRKCDLI